MILYFPDSDTLRLALTSGTIPAGFSLKPAVAGFDDEGHVWIESAEVLPRPAQTALAHLGVQVNKTSGAPLSMDVCCWLQVLALEWTALGAEQNQPAPQAPVLFELTDTSQLSGLVAEILRLGNDRQSFRWLENDGQTTGLLRVIGPPYYSLLRALDRSGQEAPPRAYVEQAPGVWMEIGYAHPFAAQIKPPKGHVLLLRPPREWIFLEEGPFTDIYDILEFELPGAKVPWHPADLEHRLRVPLRLTHGGKGDDAELWVLHEQAFERLDTFVRDADDQLLARLAFAVCENHAHKCIVLRVRPSKLPSPILVLEGVAFRSFLKLPNLFLPCATQLHPPLRRDAVRKLLADDPDRITWLYPQPEGSFTPESIPDQAFRPLTDWVDYVVDHDRVALQTWVEAARFDFEPFICKDDQQAPPPKSPAKEPRGEGKDKSKPAEAPMGQGASFKVVDRSRKKKGGAALELAEVPPIKPSELQNRLRDLEKQFLDIPGPLDSAQRQELWPELAVLNKALKNDSDVTVCWVNALWEENSEASTWARGECLGDGANETGVSLDRVLANEHPGLGELRGLASRLTWAAFQGSPAPLRERLDRIQRFLETHENLLPVRAAWLAWVSVSRLGGGDVLALARVRDRLLERLFTHGLRVDQDLPSFLRFSGMRGSERFRMYRDWLTRLPDKIHRWIEGIHQQVGDATAKDSEAYADLILAFGLARLGESSEARKLRHRAEEHLGHRDDIHSTLLETFGYRINQALDGKPGVGSLPPEQLEYLDHIAREPRYRVDRLRASSRILEPHERIDPYRQWTARFFDEVIRAVAFLSDIADRKQLAEQIRHLLQTSVKGASAPSKQALILRKTMELAPRVGEAFTLEMLAKVAGVLERLKSLASHQPGSPEEKEEEFLQASLIEKSLFAAAHFNHVEYVAPLVSHFAELLQRHRGGKNLQALNSVAGECFRGLRKLGLRDVIDRLLKRMADVILEGKHVKSVQQRTDRAALLGALLHVASGWFYFGQESQARPVIEQTRAALFKANLHPREQTLLACTYLATLGQAPAELALPWIEELFKNLERINDTFTTNSHYSLSQLQVVEAVVLAVVTEEFAVGSMARHWMEDDEFLVRRRIHRDINAALSH